MTETGSAITLQLPDPDSCRVLRAALATAIALHNGSADYHADPAPIRSKAGDAADAARHKRAATVYRHRADVAKRLLDQVPE